LKNKNLLDVSVIFGKMETCSGPNWYGLRPSFLGNVDGNVICKVLNVGLCILTLHFFIARQHAVHPQRDIDISLPILSLRPYITLWYCTNKNVYIVKLFPQSGIHVTSLCGRDGPTICGPQRVRKSTCVSL